MYDRYSLLHTASNFDLSTVEGRRGSHKLLTDLFYDLQKFIRPKTFLEFGAFDAGFSRRIRTLHPASKVIAFEANPYNYKHFTEKFDFQSSNIEYNHLAVSDQDGGSISFQVQRARDGVPVNPVKGDDSLLKRNVSDPHEVYRAVEYETVTVDTVTLDGYLNEAQFGLDDYSAWIDVEGALRSVLNGARRTLTKTHSLIIEIEEKPHWGGQWTGQDVEDFLSAAGFKPIARDFEFEHQYNVIFVRDEVIRHYGFNQMMVKYFTRLGKAREEFSPKL